MSGEGPGAAAGTEGGVLEVVFGDDKAADWEGDAVVDAGEREPHPGGGGGLPAGRRDGDVPRGADRVQQHAGVANRDGVRGLPAADPGRTVPAAQVKRWIGSEPRVLPRDHLRELVEAHPEVLVLVRVLQHQLYLRVRVTLPQARAYRLEVLEGYVALLSSVELLEQALQAVLALEVVREPEQVHEAREVDVSLAPLHLHQLQDLLGLVLEAQSGDRALQLIHGNRARLVEVEYVKALLKPDHVVQRETGLNVLLQLLRPLLRGRLLLLLYLLAHIISSYPSVTTPHMLPRLLLLLVLVLVLVLGHPLQLPARFRGQDFQAKVKFDGLEYEMLLDTGSHLTVVKGSLCRGQPRRRLEAAPCQCRIIRYVNGQVTACRTQVTIEVDGLQFQGVVLVATDCDSQFEQLQGILGLAYSQDQSNLRSQLSAFIEPDLFLSLRYRGRHSNYVAFGKTYPETDRGRLLELVPSYQLQIRVHSITVQGYQTVYYENGLKCMLDSGFTRLSLPLQVVQLILKSTNCQLVDDREFPEFKLLSCLNKENWPSLHFDNGGAEIAIGGRAFSCDRPHCDIGVEVNPEGRVVMGLPFWQEYSLKVANSTAQIRGYFHRDS